MTRELAEDLAAAGHDVTVMTGWPNYPAGRLFPGYRRKWRSVERAGGFRLVRTWHTLPDRRSFLSRLLWFFTFAGSSLLNTLACRRFDVVYSHNAPIFGPGLTLLACRLKRMKYAYGIFDLYPEAAAEVGAVSRGLVYRLCRKLDTWVCRHADSIPTLGPGIRASLQARGIGTEKVPIIPFWLDDQAIRPMPRDNPWRREHGIAPEKFVVLYAGTIGRISGAAMMADVAGALRDEGDLLFLFVGEGVGKDELLDRSRRMGLTNMMFLPFQPAERLAEVQATADVGMISLLSGASRNSIPSKVLGYLAAGRCVLASVDEDSDTADCIRQAGCGLSVPAQDVEAMVRAIRQVKAPGVAGQYGQRAREYFLRHFSRSAGTGQYRNLLEGLARQGASDGNKMSRTRTTPSGAQVVLARPRPGKRFVEALASMGMLVALSPFMLLAGLLVKLTSAGPVFYRDERLGEGGSVFRMFKFRSMKVGAPPLITTDGKLIVRKKDPRLTAVGGLLRGSKIDELPQLLNVLRGQMSFIGPRAGQPKYEKDYTDLARQRLRVKPGITGLASVVGGRHLSNETLYKLDKAYVDYQNAWMDLLIVLMTPVFVALGPRLPRRALARYLRDIDPAELDTHLAED
jgi:colanic acid biosynthesis glycosyl transferase WcaI